MPFVLRFPKTEADPSPDPRPANVREQGKGASQEEAVNRTVCMGVDAGDHAHFAVVEREGLGPRRLVHASVVDSHRMVAWAARLRAHFGVGAAVVDSKPLRVEARDIAAQAPDATWLLDFSASEEVREKEGRHEELRFKRVTVGREEMIDSLVDLLTMEPPGILLPRATPASAEALGLVRAHLRNLKREVVRTSAGVRQRYRRDVENHFGFSIAMAVLAGRMAGSAPRWAPVRLRGAAKAAPGPPDGERDTFIPIGYLVRG